MTASKIPHSTLKPEMKSGEILVYKKCGPGSGQISLDAELGGCGTLLQTLRPWIDKSDVC